MRRFSRTERSCTSAPAFLVEQPIHLVFISTGADDSAVYCRNRILAGAGSQATVVESYIGTGAAATLTNTVTDVVAEAGATLEHYRLQREGEGAAHVGTTRVRQRAPAATPRMRWRSAPGWRP